MENIIQTLIPAVSARMLTEEQRKAFEEGLSLLENNPRAKSFVSDSRSFRDYHRRVRQMITYRQTMETQATATPQKRKLGRPTKEAQKAYNEE